MQPLVWSGVYGLELLFLALPAWWRFKRPLAWLLVVSLLASTGWLAWVDRAVWFCIVLPFTLFRLLNLARIIKGRMHPMYLQQVTFRTSAVLALMTAVAITFTIPFVAWYIRYLPLLQLVVAACLLVVTIKNIRKLRFVMPKTYLVDRELPTVTVAIPAKNESQDLSECLDSILASDYPKLEIIVLDETSQSQTANIIKGYAHDGVRFVLGDEPAERWLAKNQAYEKLYQEASGELILFCGVDVRFERHAIRNMVNVMYDRKKAMLSVLPKRDNSSLAAVFIQPMRYWWELALPRRLFNRPPVLSTCWLINRKKLKKLGGFASVSHTIIPEGYFARELVKTDEYSFIRSSNDLQIQTVKSLRAQQHTAVRTQYPKIRRRPQIALFLTIFNIVFLLGPFIGFVAGFWYEQINVLACAVAALLLIATHVLIVTVSDPANSLEAVLTFPLAVIAETVMGYISMIQYEFFTVTWKGRDITPPVMHVIPKDTFLAEVTKE